jgi:hypothetical protein
VLESYALDPATEKCVLLLQAIERGVQLHGNCVGLISDDDQLDIDFLYSIRILRSPMLCLPHSKAHLDSRITGNDLRGKVAKIENSRLLRSPLHCDQVAGTKCNRHVDAT